MRLLGRIELPAHKRPGGFDHAAVSARAGRLYVAHTANDAVDVIDCFSNQYSSSIDGLAGVAGVLVSDEAGYAFTSNRAEDAVGILDLQYHENVTKVHVGVRPNGLAFDSGRGLLLVANVGNPGNPDTYMLSVVDVERRQMIHSIPVPGRTRWSLFDATTGRFYVNIAEPAVIAVVDAGNPSKVARLIEVPAKGPHGLDLDASTGRLFCACDAGKLFALNAESGAVLMTAELSGTPDVIFFNAERKHLYVAVGDPGVIDVFDTGALRRLGTVETSMGAHTLGFDRTTNKVYAFEPGSHSAVVYEDIA